MRFAFNLVVSALAIATASWLSRRYPVGAGFLVALPLASLLVLPLSYLEHGSPASSFALARSILLAIPVAALFFVPFLVAERLGLSFWTAYASGCAVLPLGFVAHAFLARLF